MEEVPLNQLDERPQSKPHSLPLSLPQTTLLRGGAEKVSEKGENLKNTFVWFERRKPSDCFLFSPTSGGLSGKKESGQLHFEGKEKPFRAPL
ncbi:hypothetical protein D0Y65_048792 [Glycine soja]|uniref:Uncharacterized protein n=1 Tax=Glycine soja TaxID=3848 RepID=A0A445FU85_GLYSO|nr:hypothetical protein D0Y65_048792 [Glycine soja]